MKNEKSLELSIDLELSESKNIFRHKKVQLDYLRTTFLLYAITFLPALIGSLLITYSYNSKSTKKYFDGPMGTILSALIGFITCNVLGCNKTVSRLIPINILLYAIFVTCFTYLSIALSINYPKIHFEVLFLMLFTNGFGLSMYALVARNRYQPKDAFPIVFAYQFVWLLYFGFLFRECIFLFIFYSAISCAALSIAAFGGFYLVQNHKADLLPSDYIYGCAQIIAVIPLLSERNNEL
jgi:hypothetical protein